MTQAIPGHSAPSAGFEAPLEMLAACHARIDNQCGVLRRLVPHMAAHGADRDARSAAAHIVRYFETSARQHHADEEEDLFPALIESMAGSDPVCLREMTKGLADDHRAIEARWRPLRLTLESIAAGDSDAAPAAADVEAFVGLYERHIAFEERELLPMAARLLGDAELDQIGRAMRERRGVAPV